MSKIKFLIPLIFLLFGLFIFCTSMILNPDLMPGDLMDARFVNYILEHGFLWLKQVPNHTEFWTPPMFWPQKNVLAISDVLLGGMLIYCPIRFFIDNPQNALQIFFVVVNILNFAIFYVFAKKIFRLEIFYCSFAAYFFAFCLPRYAQTLHLQMFLQFYMILPIFFLCLIKNNNSKNKNLLYFALASFSFVLLTYSAFYYAWFLSFGIILILLIMFSFRGTREKIINYFKSYNVSFLIPTFISLGLIAILIIKYLSVNINFHNLFSANISQLFISGSYLDYLIFSSKTSLKPDVTIGFGIFTTLLILISIFKTKYKYQIVSFVFISLLIFNYEPVYNWFYENIFVFKSIRAVSRYVFLLVPIFALTLAYLFKGIKNKILFIVLFLIFLIEQIPCADHFQWKKTEHNKRIETLNFPKNCNAVGILIDDKAVDYLVIENIMDVVWWASDNNKYTSNGYGAKVGNVNNLLNPQCIIFERDIE